MAAAGDGAVEPGGGEECYYSVLGVERDASQRDIERAWKRRALECHPDKAPEEAKEAAEARFKEVARAHEVLADPDSRRLYDLHGPSLKPQFFAGGPPGAGGAPWEGDFENEQELFEAMLRAMMQGARRKPAPPRDAGDVWDGVLGLGIVGIALAASWVFSPFLGRWANWARWQWKFLLHDLGSMLARS